jgi:hypothetical protein
MAIFKNTSIPGTSGLQLPSGTTAQRPSTPTNGQLWFNTTLRQAEFYDASSLTWKALESNGSAYTSIARSRSKLGMSAATPASSAKEILYENPGATNGVYWINLPTVGVKPCYCDMTYNGGGWILIMKSNGDSTMGYSATYWTTANVLNETTPDRTANINAKYDAFNYYNGTDIMARWAGFGDHRWLRNGAWLPGTALANFQVYRNWGYPQDQPDWNPTYFSAQQKQGGFGLAMVPQYGTNLSTSLGTVNTGPFSVRWGYRFNENGPGAFSSDDAGGGIGGNRNGTQYGAGDWYSCCGWTGANRYDRVEVYIR